MVPIYKNCKFERIRGLLCINISFLNVRQIESCITFKRKIFLELMQEMQSLVLEIVRKVQRIVYARRMDGILLETGWLAELVK